MSLWGDEYGELWGDAIASIETHVQDGLDRRVYALRCAPNFEKMMTIFLKRWQTLENAITGIQPFLLFDYNTAYGANLDQIGEILGLRREGWSDEQYRIFLRTQSLLILTDRRTQRRLLEVIRSLMNTDAGTIAYSEVRPKTYIVGIEADLDDLILWNRLFLERCRPATYNAFIIWNPEDAFGYEDLTGSVVVDVEGYSDGTGSLSRS